MSTEHTSNGTVYNAGKKFVAKTFPKLLQKIGFSKQEAQESSATLGLFFGAASKYSAMVAVPAVTVCGLAVASVVSSPVLVVAATVAFATGYGATGFFGAGVLAQSKQMYEAQERARENNIDATLVECEQPVSFKAANRSKTSFKAAVEQDTTFKKPVSDKANQNASKFNR